MGGAAEEGYTLKREKREALFRGGNTDMKTKHGAQSCTKHVGGGGGGGWEANA